MSKTTDNKPKTESLLVGATFNDNGTVRVLIIGKPRKGNVPDIVNAFEGMEADELWRRLNSVKNKEK